MVAGAVSQDVAAGFYQDAARMNLLPLWKIVQLMTPEPTTNMVPYLWRWRDLAPIVETSGQVAPVERGGERRALQLANPGFSGEWATTNTLVAAVQLLLPGEVAPAHRHTPSAIRFIIEGSNAYTAIDGERCYMHPGDLVLTPCWTWHDHASESDRPVIWMDGLDVPLVRHLNAMFFQPYERSQYPQTRPVNNSKQLFGAGHLKPTWERLSASPSPLLIYSWEQTEMALRGLADREGSPFDGIALEYVNPQTGGPVLPTMACWVQLIQPMTHLRAHRHTGSAVYHVVRGQGYTVINGQRFDWSKGDFLAVPPWAWHEHANTSSSEEAILFSIQDTPVFTSLGLYREEALATGDGHQQVTGVFGG